MRLITTFAMMAVAVAAFADDFDRKIASIDVLRDKAVQKDMGVTTGQLTTLNKFATEFETTMRKKIEEYQKAKKQPDEPFRKFSDTQVNKLRGQVLGVLSEGQVKRLREITIQAAGPRAILDANVAAKIGLTTAEHKAFLSAIQEGDRALARIKQDVAMAVQAKHKNDAKPKNGKESDALQKKLFAEINEGMKKREGETKAILQKADKKTAAIIKKTHMDKLKTLMGKAFVAKPAGKK